MPHLDAVEMWIWKTTGRTLDQHAADPVPAAAHLPASADLLRLARSALLLAVDALRTRLINTDDLTGPPDALSEVDEAARDYESARTWVDKLINDRDRTAYAEAAPGLPVWRRYVKPGDTVWIVLPHTQPCRVHNLAGKCVKVRVNVSEAELDTGEPSGRMYLPHAAAGIYRDHVQARLYVLQVGGQPTTSP